MAWSAVLYVVLIAFFLIRSTDPDRGIEYHLVATTVYLVGILSVVRGLVGCPIDQRLIWYLLLARLVWDLVFIPFRNIYVSDLVWWTLDNVARTLIYVAAASVLVQYRVVKRDHNLWIDVCAIVLSAAFLLHVFVQAPLLERSGISALVVINAAIMPTVTIVLISLTLMLTFTLRSSNVALSLLIAAFLLHSAGNITVQLALMDVLSMPRLQASSPFSLILTALIGLAALHPSAHAIAKRPSKSGDRLGAGPPILLVVAFVLSLVCLLFGKSAGAHVSPVMVAVVLTTMFFLVVLRVSLSARSLSRSHQKIARLAMRDGTTGMVNMLGLSAEYDRISQQGDPKVALLLIRLRSFHEIGQLWCIAVRDRWITKVASQLEYAVAHEGVIARVGTDQFVLLARNRTGNEAALNKAARQMIEAVRNVTLDGTITITCSADIGITSSAGTSTLESLLGEAESALDLAHSQGEDRYVHFDSTIAASQQRRLLLLTALRGAVDHNELALHFQPIVDMNTRTTIAHEALLRWNPRILGSVSPSEFIPLAESIDAIDNITDWVLNTGCAAIGTSNAHPLDGYRLSVNISVRSLRRPGLSRRVADAIERHQLRPADLCIEVTEREDFEDRHLELVALRNLGVCIAIDDFGSGYSNISMLAKVSADIVKLDIEFVRLVETNVAMHGLCRSLAAANVRVVAEGIETEAQHELMLQLGCRYGQGWLYGRPQALMHSV